MVTTNITTVDEFMLEQGLREAFIVSIDVEGFDALVLEGMRRTIEERRVRIFEFEFGKKGFWAHSDAAETRSLTGMLRGWLGRAGYSCFWQTKSGQLVPVLDPCWVRALAIEPARSKLIWSNLLCAHEPSVLDLFARPPLMVTAHELMAQQQGRRTLRGLGGAAAGRGAVPGPGS